MNPEIWCVLCAADESQKELVAVPGSSFNGTEACICRDCVVRAAYAWRDHENPPPPRKQSGVMLRDPR